MAEITADLIKRLRENTGAGMMDCKKALSESGGNFDDSVDWLRKKGLAAAQRKAGRVAAEGLVAVVVDGGRGAIVEVAAAVCPQQQLRRLVTHLGPHAAPTPPGASRRARPVRRSASP